MTLRVVTPASAALVAQLVSLKEAKDQLRVTSSHEHDRITRLVRVALEDVESMVQRRYLTQTLDWVLQGWEGCLRLPVSPVAEVTSIRYRDEAGDEQTIDAADYRVRPVGRATVITPADHYCWPLLGDHAEPVTIRFVAGSAAAEVPESAKQAVLLRLQGLYENRDIPVDTLLSREIWS